MADTVVDDVAARLRAILSGSYPVATPYLASSIFVEQQVTVPQANPAFPAGSQSAALDRRFELLWPDAGWNPGPEENGSQGPWIRGLAFALRMQYAVRLPRALAPTSSELALGAMELASRRAQSDAIAIEWALLRPGAWDGVAVGVTALKRSAVAKDGRTRAVLTISGEIAVSVSVASAPALWSA